VEVDIVVKRARHPLASYPIAFYTLTLLFFPERYTVVVL
jgi:hypothetical protein